MPTSDEPPAGPSPAGPLGRYAEIRRYAEIPVFAFESTLRDEEGFEVAVPSGDPERLLRQPTVQRLGVALTGYLRHLEADRVQMIGRSESGYLATLSPEARTDILGRVAAVGFPAVVVTSGQPVTAELVEVAERFGLSVIYTEYESSDATARLNVWLTAQLARRESRHGVLVDVHGVGVLLSGESGVGKSEIALELVARGHRLVADDAVTLTQHSPTTVVGSSPRLTRHFMEIRGLGIINARDLFGAAAVREQKRVELVVELIDWTRVAEVDRLGLDERRISLAGVPVRTVTLPVRPGRSLALIIEVAARDRLLRAQGTHSARALVARVEAHLSGSVEGSVEGNVEATVGGKAERDAPPRAREVRDE